MHYTYIPYFAKMSGGFVNLPQNVFIQQSSRLIANHLLRHNFVSLFVLYIWKHSSVSFRAYFATFFHTLLYMLCASLAHRLCLLKYRIYLKKNWLSCLHNYCLIHKSHRKTCTLEATMVLELLECNSYSNMCCIVPKMYIVALWCFSWVRGSF